MTDATITQIIGLLGTMFAAYMAFKMAQLNIKAQKAVDVQEENKKVLDVVHELTNSASLAQDKVIMELLATKAELTKIPADIEAAEVARVAYEERQKSQKAASDKAQQVAIIKAAK